MLRGSFAERLMKFVENGGVAVVTYFCGMASETDLCYLGETPAARSVGYAGNCI